MAERFVDVPGGRLFMQDDGSGPAIVLLHAGIVDSRGWDSLVPPLVERGYRAVRYDARGFGRTTTEDVPFSNRADVMAILDAIGVRRACLVGNSRGGQIAVDTAIEYPERVAALVLLGASVGGYEPEPSPEEAAAFAEMERLEADLKERADRVASADFMVRLWVDGFSQPEGRAARDVREAVRTMAFEVADPSRIYGQPIPLEPRAAERLAELEMPVLAVAGDLDVSDIWATALHLEEAAPNARAVRLPGVAHMIAMEVPERVAELIAEVLAPLGAFE